jgi:deazaflavin-dependent oxidoreductase (nitroreductase family)
VNPVVETVGRAFLTFHQALYTNTDGRVGHRMLGVPCLLMRSTGRKTGIERTNALVYAKDGNGYVVVASNGGSDRPPGWLHNVRAKPEVEIQVARKRMPGSARIVEKGDSDYDRLWRLVNEKNHGRYDGYQKNTDRPISLVVLEPA